MAELDELKRLVLGKIRERFSRGAAAPGSKALYLSLSRKKHSANAVDAALSVLVADGVLRITDGRWFEVGKNRSELEEKERQIAAARIKKAERGKLRPRKVDNRKASPKPRGMKPSAAARTLSLEGVK